MHSTFSGPIALTLLLLFAGACSSTDQKENGESSSSTAYLGASDLQELGGLDPSLKFRYGYPEDVMDLSNRKAGSKEPEKANEQGSTQKKPETKEEGTEDQKGSESVQIEIPPEPEEQKKALQSIKPFIPPAEYQQLIKDIQKGLIQEESAEGLPTSERRRRVLVVQAPTSGTSSFLMKHATRPSSWPVRKSPEQKEDGVSAVGSGGRGGNGDSESEESQEQMSDNGGNGSKEKAEPCPENQAPRASRRFAAEILRDKNKTTRLFSKVNSRGRDYRLRQSPKVADPHFYFMSNRGTGVFRVFRLKSMVQNGEIVMDQDPEMLSIPFLDKNILGYDLCVDQADRYRLVYSHDCAIYETTSSDGLNFDEPVKLEIDTAFCERDPAFSPDCNTVVYTRSLEDDIGVYRMSEVYISRRPSVDEAFSAPKKIPDSYNYEGSNTPFILYENNREFIFFVKNLKKEELVSSEITPKGPSLPEKVELSFQGKYPFCSTRQDTGMSCFTSLWVDGFEWDLYQMDTARSIPIDPQAKKNHSCELIPQLENSPGKK